MQPSTYLGDLLPPLTEKNNGTRVVLDIDEPWFIQNFSSINAQEFFDHYLPFCVDLMNEIGFEGISNERTNIKYDIHKDEVTSIQETAWLHPSIGLYNLHLIYNSSEGIYVCKFWNPSNAKFAFSLEHQHKRRTDLGNAILEVIRSEYIKN